MLHFGCCSSPRSASWLLLIHFTFKMKHFLIIVNTFQLLTIITKHPILDVAAVLDPPLTVSGVSAVQKQSLADVLQNRCQACNFIKKRLQYRYFPMKYKKIFRTSFLQNTSALVAASGSKQCKPMKTYTESLCWERSDIPERYF